MKIRLPSSVQNWISLIGLTIVIICLLMIATLFILSTFLGHGSLYLGLVIYILLPAVMLAGFFLIILGMILKSRRMKKQKDRRIPSWPRIDLNVSRQRRTFFFFSLGTALFLIISALGSYEAFHFTESNQFCGQLCHIIMEPEHTAYQNSPHSRVACVECHVGPGADWYVRSKLSGLYQVYATVLKKYPTPIPTPIENLRPAREVCEQCHWPQKFYTHNIRFETYFLSDEKNPEWDTRLVMKIGSEHHAEGLKEGIHWHINPDVRIEYRASDEKREEISWVKYTNLRTNRVIVYENQESPQDESGTEHHDSRIMDCMDCHNRPSHDYLTPSRFINTAMKAGELPRELPNIKALAMDVCEDEYDSTDSALQNIQERVLAYYQEDHPDIFRDKKDLVDKAAETIQKLYTQYIFPEMKVRWDVHSNHIGHLDFKGCFRCHSGQFASKNDEIIRHDCNLCHLITAQGPPEDMEVGMLRQPLEFRHPVDIDQAWKEALCSDCHSGGSM